jgi:hypothetical protein
MKKAFPRRCEKGFCLFCIIIPFSHQYFSDEHHNNANDMRMKNHLLNFFTKANICIKSINQNIFMLHNSDFSHTFYLRTCYSTYLQIYIN